MKTICALYAALLILAACDVMTTAMLLSRGGAELNPVAGFAMTRLGFLQAAFLKFGFVFVFGGLLVALKLVAAQTEQKLARNISIAILAALVTFYVFVVSNNLYWLILAEIK